MRRKRIEIIAIAVLIVGIIGYAGAGLVVSGLRVAGAERTLNTVVSHQNTLNSTFSDINTQLSALSSSSAFNPQQAIVLVDKSVSNSELATKTINADDASLVAASSQLGSLMSALSGFAADFGKQLDGEVAGEDASVAVYEATVHADQGKISAYDIDKIGAEIATFYKPLIDRFNSEITAATS